MGILAMLLLVAVMLCWWLLGPTSLSDPQNKPLQLWNVSANKGICINAAAPLEGFREQFARAIVLTDKPVEASSWQLAPTGDLLVFMNRPNGGPFANWTLDIDVHKLRDEPDGGRVIILSNAIEDGSRWKRIEYDGGECALCVTAKPFVGWYLGVEPNTSRLKLYQEPVFETRWVLRRPRK